MAKEIVWSETAKTDFWDIIFYLNSSWPPKVLDNFTLLLNLKLQLLSKHPHLGYKSEKYSRFRKTIVAKSYVLIYSVKKDHIVILRLKISAMK